MPVTTNQKINKQEEANTQRLFELKKTILIEKASVDIKLYSHNIISCTLRIIDDEFGKAIANDVIVSMGLEELGWNVSE